MRTFSESTESATIRTRRCLRRPRLSVGIFSAVSLLVSLQAATVSVSVSALQPAQPKNYKLPRTVTTSLDYVASPERVSTSTSTGTSTRTRSSKTLKQEQPKQKQTEIWDQIYATPVTTASSGSHKRRTILRTGPKINKRKTLTLSGREQMEAAYQLRANPQALLTRDQEILYTERIHALRQAETIRDVRAVNSTMESQWATACGFANKGQLRRVLEQGQDARLQLVQANMGLVTSIAKRHYAALKKALEAGQGVGSCLTLQDCLQEGQLGLMEAAERFDPQRGVRFGTYATWWIRQRILKSITDSSRMIRLPAHVHQTLQKIKKAKVQMTQEIGREPSVPELAHYLEMPIAKLQQYTQVTRNVISLENPLQKGRSLSSSAGGAKMAGSDSTAVLGDMIASDSPTPQEHVQQQMLRQDLQQVLQEVLTETERQVVHARFGLDDGSPKSIQETANVLAISRDRVRLVETKALNKLRRSPQKNGRLKTYVSSERGEDTRSREKDHDTIDHRMHGNDNNHNIYSHHSHPQSSQRVNPFASSPLEYTPKARAAVRVVHNTDRDATSATAAATASAVMEGISEEQRQLQEQQHPMYHGLPPAPAPDRMWFF